MEPILCGTFRTTVSLLFSVGVFDSLALVPSHATGTMLALLALVLPAVLAVAPASSVVELIYSENSRTLFSSFDSSVNESAHTTCFDDG